MKRQHFTIIENIKTKSLEELTALFQKCLKTGRDGSIILLHLMGNVLNDKVYKLIYNTFFQTTKLHKLSDHTSYWMI